MGVLRAKILIPGVRVRVKMNDTQGWMMLGHSTQNRQRDGMITADTERSHAMHQQLLNGDFDTLESVFDRQRIDGDISVVGDAMAVEGIDFQVRMIGPNQRRLHPDMPRTE